MPKFYLELFKTLILEFVYIHSKCSWVCLSSFRNVNFLSKQNRFDTNSPVSLIFNLIIKREGTRKPQDLLLAKIHFVLSLLARNTANHSYASSLEVTGNQLEYEQLRSKPLSPLLIPEDELISKINSKIKDDNEHLMTGPERNR